MNKTITLASFFLTILFLYSCRTTNYLTSVEASKQTIEEKLITSDAGIEELIQPYKTQLDQQMNASIGTTANDLKKKRPESSLGNWVADAIQRQTELSLGQPIDFAIQNYGGMRISDIKKGTITRGKIYELMPFDNKIVLLSLDSREIKELLQHLIDSGGWPLSHSIKVVQDSSEQLNIFVRGEPIQDNKKYQIALPDYVANGGSDSGFLKGKSQQIVPLFIRDALIADVEAHTAKGQAIESRVEGRLVLNK